MQNKSLILVIVTLTTGAALLSWWNPFVETQKAVAISAQAACTECGKPAEKRNPLITDEICKNWSKKQCENHGLKFGE